MRLSSLPGGIAALLISQFAVADVIPHLVLTAGISGGGDTLATIRYNNAGSDKVTAGGGFYLGGGPSLEFTGSPVSLQAVLGYHIDDSSPDRAKSFIRFDRTTLDLMGFYRIGNHRLGAGMYSAMGPAYHNDAFTDANGYYYPSHTVEFSDSNGPELEYDYLPTHSHFGLSVRAVSVSYAPKSLDGAPVTGSSVNGNFIAAGVYFYL